jgi:hypothetical protein
MNIDSDTISYVLLAFGMAAVTIYLASSVFCAVFYRERTDVDQITMGVFLATVLAFLL